MNNQKCHDCGKEIKKGAKFMPYEAVNQIFAKCEKCHKKDPVLRNFQKTEVYSRIVGYIRPVAQWNNGKAEEYKDRKEYSVKSPGCC
jgi:anaerobic ribonucleoside-triphosphate reductase